MLCRPNVLCLTAWALTLASTSVSGFLGDVAPSSKVLRGVSRSLSSVAEDGAFSSAPPSSSDDDEASRREREALKLSLLRLSASYDRGYGSTPASQRSVADLVERLEARNPTLDASRGVGDAFVGDAPVDGAWRMVWTTAPDVLVLNASPLTTVGAVYQIIDAAAGTAVNVIDLLPRGQALLPFGAAPSLLRAEVSTTITPRTDAPSRLGLDFNSVALRPVRALGFDAPSWLPPARYDFPDSRRLLDALPGSDPNNRPNYFDVSYLDEDMLVVQQNAPGGMFVLIKTDDYEP